MADILHRFPIHAPADRVFEAITSHTGWADAGEHFRISSYCWAAYLRLLRLYVEEGQIAPYEKRLNV